MEVQEFIENRLEHIMCTRNKLHFWLIKRVFKHAVSGRIKERRSQMTKTVQ